MILFCSHKNKKTTKNNKTYYSKKNCQTNDKRRKGTQQTKIEQIRMCPPSKNLIQQGYLVSNINDVFCSDITIINKSVYLVFVLDLGSRLILSHLVTEHYTSSDDLIRVVQEAIKNRKINIDKTIFHCDQGVQYTSIAFRDFAYNEGLVLSYADRCAHQNQVAERWNRTLKILLQRRFEDIGAWGGALTEKATLSSLSSKYSCEEVSSYINSCVEKYNSTPHGGKGMFKASPFIMDEALCIEPPFKTTLALNDNSLQALEIREFRAKVIEKHAGSWDKFFLGWKQEQGKQLHDLYELNRHLLDQSTTTNNQNLSLKKQMDFLVGETQLIKEERELKSALKRKRANARKLPIRDAITQAEFDFILGHVTQDSYKASRCRVALILLYYTGLRISNLLVIRIFHMEELWRLRETKLSLIKRGSSRHFTCIGTQGSKILDQYSLDILKLQANKKKDDFLFTAMDQKDCKKALGRSYFDNEVNMLLKKVSISLGKHIRSHSFRASFVTDMLENNIPINVVKEIVGHSDIKSTSTYQRSTITQNCVRGIIAKVNNSRSKKFVEKEYESQKKKK